MTRRTLDQIDGQVLRTTDKGTELPRCSKRPRCVLWDRHRGYCLFEGEAFRAFGPRFQEDLPADWRRSSREEDP